jgi:DNA segregation ATPase FtsK/SpoIIIE, S-DNA-T family
MRMRREISGIFLFFLVIFILISLLSYSPHDPSIHNAGPTGQIHNLFGVFGAQLAGLLVGLWGIGAFWIPIIFLISSIQFFSNQPRHRILITLGGGLILVITTGSLLAVTQNQYALFGQSFSSGGMLGIPLKSFFVRYAGPTGGTIILLVFWLIGFVMATGFSLVRFAAVSAAFARYAIVEVKTRYERFKKNRSQAAKNKTIKDRSPKTKPQPKTKLKIIKTPPKAQKAPQLKQEVFDFMRAEQGFQLPPISFLDDADERIAYADNENLQMKSKLLEKKLEDFGVNGQVVAVTPGPVITTFEYAPAPGVKINKVVSLSDDLALALRATSIRIVAPIPGKAVIGIEVPNAERETVRFKELVVDDSFTESKSKLTLCLGKSIEGNPVAAALEKMPHLLIAGATGSGKSVALNTMIGSFLYKTGPEDVKLIMIDPKRIELSIYDGIPHLITPVVTDVKKATNALHWAVKEMERRYQLLSDKRARNLQQYNNKIAKQKKTADGKPESKLPLIVIIIDELADLMMVASRDVEVALTRLAQMARAAGIHLILATQRPSVDVLTGIIKANFPTRLSFQVSSKTDSRTIIDTNGAENLLGNGDMLFLPPGTAKLQRIHGAYISESEISRIIDFLKEQKAPEYDEAVITTPAGGKTDGGDTEYDEKYDEALALVTKLGQASISGIQRHLRIGYNRAARIIETMETEGVVGPSDGAKPREVLVRGYEDIP